MHPIPKIYVLHENETWVQPLRAAFAELALPYAEWFLDQGVVDFSAAPPQGVFYNRMSASSHTRGHRYGPEYTGAVLAWLKAPRDQSPGTARPASPPSPAFTNRRLVVRKLAPQ